MHSLLTLSWIAAALFTRETVASPAIKPDLSFGHESTLSSNGEIAGYRVYGSPAQPSVLSNRVLLTPIAPGNVRSSLWSVNSVPFQEWNLELSFRANGPERGGGNLNLWIARDGERAVGTSSLYNVQAFEGFGLVIDAFSGSAGMIRGFLNDGSKDFRQQSNLDDHRFGQCTYGYRNLGRPSTLKVSQEASLFRVEIDGRLCFATDQVRLPTGYQLGITAATPDTPDSFEIFKFTLTADEATRAGENAGQPKIDTAKSQPKQAAQNTPPVTNNNANNNNDKNNANNNNNNKKKNSANNNNAQVTDLQARVQTLLQQVSSIQRSVAATQQSSDRRHAELKGSLDKVLMMGQQLESLSAMNGRLSNLETEIRAMRKDITSVIRDQETSLQNHLNSHHTSLRTTLTDTAASSSSSSRLLLLVVLAQTVLGLGYYVHQQRKERHVKYL